MSIIEVKHISKPKSKTKKEYKEELEFKKFGEDPDSEEKTRKNAELRAKEESDRHTTVANADKEHKEFFERMTSLSRSLRNPDGLFLYALALFHQDVGRWSIEDSTRKSVVEWTQAVYNQWKEDGLHITKNVADMVGQFFKQYFGATPARPSNEDLLVHSEYLLRSVLGPEDLKRLADDNTLAAVARCIAATVLLEKSPRSSLDVASVRQLNAFMEQAIPRVTGNVLLHGIVERLMNEVGRQRGLRIEPQFDLDRWDKMLQETLHPKPKEEAKQQESGEQPRRTM